MNKRGFTLIELLAVIVLLGVISALVTTGYKKYIDVSKESAYKDSMYSLISEIEDYILNNRRLDYSDEIEISSIIDELDLDNANNLDGSFKLDDNYVELIDVTNGKYCANGDKNTMSIKKGNCE